MYFVIKTNSDKSIIIFMVFYPLLTLINFIISLVLRALKWAQTKIYKQTTIGLLILFVPLIFIVAQL